MTCTDCKEPITEGERKNARTCAICKGPLHGECSMSSPTEEDQCESCQSGDSREFRLRMMKAANA